MFQTLKRIINWCGDLKLKLYIGFVFSAMSIMVAAYTIGLLASSGYFQQNSTGNILNSITTGLNVLENMGIRMVDNFVGGYLNFLVVFLCLLCFSPVTAFMVVRYFRMFICSMIPSAITFVLKSRMQQNRK